MTHDFPGDDHRPVGGRRRQRHPGPADSAAATASPASASSPRSPSASSCRPRLRCLADRAPSRRSRRRRDRPRRASCASTSTSGPTSPRRPTLTRELEREYRAVVEEILELRGDDGRISAFVRSITHPGALADTAGYSPDLNFDAEDRAARNARRRRASEAGAAVAAGAARRTARAQAHSRRRGIRRAEAAARILPAPADGRDPQGARRERRLGRRGISQEDRGRRNARGGAASRPSASSSRFERMGDSNAEASMIRTYLDWLLAVPWSKRSEERLDPVHAREVLDADHAGLDDVKRRITEYLAVRKLRAERGLADDRRSGAILTLIGPPGTGKTSIGESIARATGPPVRPHVARRRSRRSGNPRPSAHLHRRAARPARARAARRRHDESGDHARRSRQARRRLARRSVVGAARSARPGAEPRVPGSLPRRRARSVARAVHCDGERRRNDSRAAARSHGSHPLRRLHDRREGRHRAAATSGRARSSATACGRRSDDRRRGAARWS